MAAIAYLLTKTKQQQQLNNSTEGFTVVEILVVVIMVGVLAAISGAGYVSWLERLRVNASRDAVLNAIQDAQIKAKQRNATWQVSIRQDGDFVKWAVHSANAIPDLNDPAWQTIEQKGVKVDTASSNPSGKGTSTNPWQVEFDNKGNTENDGDRITLSNSTGGIKRCVTLKTILGAIRTEDDKSCE